MKKKKALIIKTFHLGMTIGKVITWGAGIILCIVIIFNCFAIVPAGFKGIVLNWDAFHGSIVDPGLHLKFPIGERILPIDTRTIKLEIQESDAYSKDLQVVKIQSAINYSLDPKEVGIIYQEYGMNFEEKILNPNLEASIKQVIAKYTGEEILNKRQEVQDDIQKTFITTIPTPFVVTKYAMVNESFSDEYEKAIEQKQVAQQDAEKAKNLLLKAQTDASSTVVAAQAQAEAIKIQAEAITQQGGQSYVDLQAVNKWNGQLPTTMPPGATVPFINLSK